MIGCGSAAQPIQQLRSRMCDLPHGFIEDRLISFGRLMKTAHLADELKRCRAHVFGRNDQIGLA